MKLSLNWINDYVDISDIDPHELMNRLTLSTAEVEELEVIGQHFEEVLIAKVEEVKPHPNAERLRIAVVFDGSEKMEVVCGAPNLEVGQVVALAKVGCHLPAGELKPAVLRGVTSEGMLLAEDELGISDDHEGILVLPEDAPVGKTIDALYGGKDVVLEIDNKSLTHRPDLWGHIGFAREVAAILERPMKVELDESLLEMKGEADPLTLDNRAPDLCPRYTGLVVDGVESRPSPMWMQRRLQAVDLRAINNLVDVTNYVMMEYGQPMHAFDRRLLEGDTIVIRRAEKGEKFTTLDEAKLVLSEENLLIADEKKGTALAGVMGGLDSSIKDDTKKIVLESANFHAANVRRTANAFNLRTDSAQRFEKSLDTHNTVPAIVRAVELLKLTCPQAHAASPLLDSWPVKPETMKVRKSLKRISKRLGLELDPELVKGILLRLEFKIEMLDDDMMELTVPTWRATKDIEVGADIVEEVGRIFGFDNIPPRPPLVANDTPPDNPQRRFERFTKALMCEGLSFGEVRNYSMVGESLFAKAGMKNDDALKLRNQLSVEEDRMRTSMVPQILKNISDNQRYKEAFRLFEMGRTYHKDAPDDKKLATERNWIVGAVSNEEREGLFIEAKGVMEALLEGLSLKDFGFAPETSGPSWAHPGRCAKIFTDGKPLGLLAEIHPRIADAFDFRYKAVVFELDADLLFEIPKKDDSFTPLRRYPTNPLELTVTVDAMLPQAEALKVMQEAGGELLIEASYMYQYEGEPIPKDKKAVTYHLLFGADDHTLSSEEVESVREGVISALHEKGMPLRGRE